MKSKIGNKIIEVMAETFVLGMNVFIFGGALLYCAERMTETESVLEILFFAALMMIFIFNLHNVISRKEDIK